MSDKISDAQLSRIAQAETADIGGAQSPIVTAMAVELISYRAAAPRALTLPKEIIYDLGVPPYVGYAYPKDKTDAALKAAGITVQDNSNDKIR